MKALLKTAANRLLRPVGLQVYPIRKDSTLVWRDLIVKDVLPPIVGEISLAEARALGELVRGLTEEGPIIEVGTLFGWSTRVMVLFKEQGRHLITVDNYCWNPHGLLPDRYHEATQAVLAEACAHQNVRLVRMAKQDFYESYDGLRPAMVFLDAAHSYEKTKEDLQWAFRTGTNLICGHDYDKEWPGVVRAGRSGWAGQTRGALVCHR